MIFDWVDVERKGRLSLEEFSSGLSMSVLGGPLGSVPSMRRGWADRKDPRTPYQSQDLHNVPKGSSGHG